MTTCAACGQPVRLIETAEDRWSAVDPEPIPVALGLPRRPVIAVTDAGETVHGLTDQGPVRMIRAYPVHFQSCRR